MSKYAPLTEYLRNLGGRSVRVSFSELEQVLGQRLPEKSKSVRAWWSNNPNNNVMTKAWLAAGYKTAQVDVADETLSFVPAATMEGFGAMKQASFKPKLAPQQDGSKDKTPHRHPAWGALKGMITILPGVDLTQPAYEDWETLYGEDK